MPSLRFTEKQSKLTPMTELSQELAVEDEKHSRLRRVALAIAKHALRAERGLPLWREEAVNEENVDDVGNVLAPEFVYHRPIELSGIASTIYFNH